MLAQWAFNYFSKMCKMQDQACNKRKTTNILIVWFSNLTVDMKSCMSFDDWQLRALS